MSNVYKGQDLRLQLTLGVGTTGATCVIKYKTPSGATGSWSATNAYPSQGIIYYDIVPVSMQTTGDWVVWGHATFSDAKVGIGIPATFTVRTEGSV